MLVDISRSNFSSQIYKLLLYVDANKRKPLKAFFYGTLKAYQRIGKPDSKAQSLIWHDLGDNGIIWDLQ